MITAKQAKTNALSINTGIAQEQLLEIEKLIETAVKAGQFKCHPRKVPGQSVITHLKSLGYKVEVGTQYNEPYCNISWDE